MRGFLGPVSPGLIFPALPTPSALEAFPIQGAPLISKWLQETKGGAPGLTPQQKVMPAMPGSLKLKGNFPSKGRMPTPFILSLRLFLESTWYQVLGQRTEIKAMGRSLTSRESCMVLLTGNPWIQVPALPLASCRTLDEQLNLAGPQFSHL